MKCFFKVVPGSKLINLFQFNTGVVKTSTIKLVLPHEKPHNRNICGYMHTVLASTPIFHYFQYLLMLHFLTSYFIVFLFYFLITNTIGILQSRKYLWCAYFSRKCYCKKSTLFTYISCCVSLGLLLNKRLLRLTIFYIWLMIAVNLGYLVSHLCTPGVWLQHEFT